VHSVSSDSESGGAEKQDSDNNNSYIYTAGKVDCDKLINCMKKFRSETNTHRLC
jgi:hypothetical protein